MYLEISEFINTTIYYSVTSNNNLTITNIVPSMATSLKTQLTTLYTSGIVSSQLYLTELELKASIPSLADFVYPETVYDGFTPTIKANNDLLGAIWLQPRREFNVYQDISNVWRLKGSVALPNRLKSGAYYFENLLSTISNDGLKYPLATNEKIGISLASNTWGLLTGNDEILLSISWELKHTILTQSSTGTTGSSSNDTVQLNAIQSSLSSIQTSLNAIPLNVYTTNFTTVNSKLDSISLAIADLQPSIPATPPVTYIRNYDAAYPTNDLINLLGTNNDTVAYANPHPNKITNSASGVLLGAVNVLTDKQDGDFLSTSVSNSWIQIDIGTNNTARTVTLTGLGLRSRIDNAAHPSSLTIEGSNDGAGFVQIFIWSNIGFSSPYQWRYITFTSTGSYRYIRIRQPGVNASGTDYLGFSEVNLYGTVSAL